MAPGFSDPLSLNDCAKFFETLLQGNFSWEWDSRFQTALTTFKTEDQLTVREILEGSMGKAWDSVTIESAPENVQHALVPFGGLMPNQLFYAADISEEGILFCAWWPWGNGQTISARIGANSECLHLLDKLIPPDSK